MTTKLYGCTFDPQTIERLKKFQQENGLSRSASIRLIIAQALGRHENSERKQ